jgi:hypothetical protein
MIQGLALLGEVDENPLVLSADAAQERLAAGVEEWNREHAADFIAPLVTPGEFPEFAAVLRRAAAAYPVARYLAELFHPLPVRVGAAWGDLNPEAVADPEQMEGPAFDAAGELLYRARKEERLLLVQSGNATLDALANALFLVLHHDLRGWTERQCEVVRLYRQYGRQQDVARKLGVSQQSVSSSLAAAGWKVLAEAEEALLTLVSPRPSERP